MGDARVQPMLRPEGPDPGRNRPRVATHDLAPTMGEDGTSQPFPLAPAKLRRDRRVCPIKAWSRRRTMDRLIVAPSPT